MSRADFDDRYQHRILMRTFSDLFAYNTAENRHPLPRLTANRPWDVSYTGFEPATVLPFDLSEDTARDFVIGAARLWDHMRRISDQRTETYMALNQAQPEARSLLFKTVNYLCVVESQLCTYVAKILHDSGLNGAHLTFKLARLGVHCEGVPTSRRNKTGFISYRPAQRYQLERLATQIPALPGASYLGYLMAHFDGSKPQYTQPLMLFMEEALDRCQILSPGQYDAFEEIKTVYRNSGMASAVSTLRDLTRQIHAMPGDEPAPYALPTGRSSTPILLISQRNS